MLRRALIVWTGLILAETLHGILRGLLLTPRVGDLRARQIGVPIGAALILAIAVATIRWIGARRTGDLLRIGALWLVLTLCFEFTLGRALGYSWERLTQDYDPTRGGYLACGMLVLFLSPWLASRSRNLGRQP